MSVATEDAGVLGLLLAGGGSRRMGGGDKNLRLLGGRPILEHVIERAAPQVGTLVLNANGDPGRFADFGLPVIADSVPGQAGPLAGVLTGLEWARDTMPGCSWVATFATDAPFLPVDLVARMMAAIDAGNADMACAASGGRAHPVFGLWPVRLAGALHAAVVDEAVRKVDSWTARYRLATVEFMVEPVDPFFNVNTHDDLGAAEKADFTR